MGIDNIRAHSKRWRKNLERPLRIAVLPRLEVIQPQPFHGEAEERGEKKGGRTVHEDGGQLVQDYFVGKVLAILDRNNLNKQGSRLNKACMYAYHSTRRVIEMHER